jgi:pimeloyl-ACP methyl ester carboxylesterase
MSLLPGIPRVPPLWRESRLGIEAAALRRSPVFDGLGVPPGERRPVLLIPGFMAGDLSLGTMAGWLRRAGYCTHRTGIRANFDCSEDACARLEARLEHMAERHDERVIVIGQSRGGVFAKALGARRPDLVEGIVTLGSPVMGQLSVHPLVLAQVGLVSALGTSGVPGLFQWSCLRGKCCEEFRAAVEGPFPDDVGYVALYSRSDGIVQWRSCLDPAADELVEVRASHCGMGVNAQAFLAVAQALARFRGELPDDPLLRDDLPRAA